MRHLWQSITFYLLLFFSLTACQAELARQWQWQRAETGLPRQAIVQTIAVNPTEPDQLWVGYYAPGGLAASRDGGQNWRISGANVPGLVDNPVFDLLVTTSSGVATVWAATRDGLMTSLDLGNSWQPVSAGLPATTALALAADATGRVYVGFDAAGLYIQGPDQSGWKSLPLAAAAILSLAVSADGRYIYAGTAGQGVWTSQDFGASWVNTYPDQYVPNIALNPIRPTLAVASLRDRLVRTLAGGQSWHTLPLPWAREEITALLWLRDGSLGAATGQGRLYRSLDNGDTWVEGGAGLPAGRAVLALAAIEQPSANQPQRLLAGSWTGLFGSEDGGLTWTELAPTLGVPEAHVLLSTSDKLLLGTQTGLFRWQADPGRWVTVAEEFARHGVASLAVAPSDPTRLYAGTVNNGVFRSDDGGQNWQPMPSLAVGVPALAVDPTDPDHVYMLAAWERVYESTDGGASWLALWEGLGVTTEATSLAVIPTGSTVFLGGDTGLYRRRGNADWDWIAPALLDQSVLALLVQPRPENLGGGAVLYIGTTRRAYRSLDDGNTLQHGESLLGWGQGLADVSVTAFLADPDDPRRLFAGTAYAGVYQSLDWGQSWQPIGPDELKGEVIESLAWGPAGELFVAAPGGVWRGFVTQSPSQLTN